MMKNKNAWRFVGFLYGQNLCHIQFSPVARQPKQRHGQSNGGARNDKSATRYKWMRVR